MHNILKKFVLFVVIILDVGLINSMDPRLVAACQKSLNPIQQLTPTDKLYELIKNQNVSYADANEKIKLLISEGLDINKPLYMVKTREKSCLLLGNPTPLVYAAAHANEHVFNALLDNGAGITSSKDQIWTIEGYKEVKENFRILYSKWKNSKKQ